MSTNWVLIVSQTHEPSTDRVTDHLKRLGCKTLRLNSEEFAFDSKCSISLAEKERGFYVHVGDLRIASDDLCAVWHRRWSYPVYPPEFDDAAISFCFSETTGFLGGLPWITRNVRWVNNIQAERSASNKIGQLVVAKELGMRIPETVIANDPQAAVHFFGTHPEGVIFKPVSGSSILYRSYSRDVLDFVTRKFGLAGVNSGMPKTRQVIYTQLLTTERLDHIQSLRWAPAIFQEFIDKEFDVRVTVVGKQIFACVIYSQERQETKVDFRVMNSGIMLKHDVFELPPHVENFVHALMARLQLEFACIDFVVDRKSGDFVFLEVNPAGQWLWVEAKTGLAISQALAEHLKAGAAHPNALAR